MSYNFGEIRIVFVSLTTCSRPGHCVTSYHIVGYVYSYSVHAHIYVSTSDTWKEISSYYFALITVDIYVHTMDYNDTHS